MYTCSFGVKFLFGLEIISNAIQANSSRKMNNELELDQSLDSLTNPHEIQKTQGYAPLGGCGSNRFGIAETFRHF